MFRGTQIPQGDVSPPKSTDESFLTNSRYGGYISVVNGVHM